MKNEDTMTVDGKAASPNEMTYYLLTGELPKRDRINRKTISASDGTEIVVEAIPEHLRDQVE